MVVLTQIGAALTTWTALGLARVSLDMVVERDAELSEYSVVELAVAGPLSFVVAGYRVVRLLGALELGCEFVHLTDCETTG